ncbi:tetratricopeptide repeat protein [Umezawaea sp. Da 62-37]|uniref:tetratricopeptide repeat protein n=1 Tax=Umezawaea sp. Da 62-37 TaxID=3075927 RepID=UPI0028F6F8AE|nr:tetratricopeptide repeat protein [Umezawaea sp. Da 62-37]WNV87121.1 tetratricopeptide repeat protein [Umezawaea sp. Da 62-37]
MRAHREPRPRTQRRAVRQTGTASEHSALHQAARDLHIHAALPPHDGAPGLASAATPHADMGHHLRGRDALLEELVSTTLGGGRTVVLHSAGGFGKTAIASTLARRVEHLVHVWWVDATTSRSLLDDLREVALGAGAPRSAVRRAWNGERSAPDLLWSALRGLGERWLLVVDNADDTTVLDAGDNHVRTGRGWIRTPPRFGAVVITSRDGNVESWGTQATITPVSALRRQDGAAVLNELAPRAGDHRQAALLSEALAGLPLALKLVGRFLDSTDTISLPGAEGPRTFDEYRTALHDHFGDAIGTLTPVAGGPHQDCLGSTWERSLDLLHDRGHSLARPLLRLLATFAPAPIPCPLLDAAALAGTAPFGDLTPGRLAAGLTALAGVGLIDVHHDHRRGLDTITLHPLIRDVTRHYPEVLDHDHGEARLALLHTATARTNAADPSTWPLWRALLPHCEHEADDPGAPVGRRRMLSDIHHGAAGFAYEHGHHITAERLYHRALRTRASALGPKHPDSLATRHNLAVLLADRGDHDEARRSLEDVLTDCTTVLGAEHPDTLATRRTLACLHRDRGDHDTAEAELRRIAGVQRRLLGATHPDTLITRYEIAVLHHHRGRTGVAASCLRALLRDQRRALGDHHAHTLITEHRLVAYGGTDLRGTDLRHVVVLAVSALGAAHPIALNARNSFAAALHAEHPGPAETEFRRIVELQSATLGSRHVETIAAQHNLDIVTRHPSATLPSVAERGRRVPRRVPNTGQSLGDRRDRVGVVDPSIAVSGPAAAQPFPSAADFQQHLVPSAALVGFEQGP